ncbi:hypothetical protein GLYMA_16G087251v4 [Glycine max]|nr:hypothetical protein GLYMA_16G087251v4 [Glycine max]
MRVYGTEEEEHGRYKWWLEKLADISLRQSAAYGVWNFSFNILYHSTQVIAVLFGGMSILAGHITAEKLRRSWSNKAPESITLSFNCPSYKKLSIALKASSGTSLKVTSEDMLSFGVILESISFLNIPFSSLNNYWITYLCMDLVHNTNSYVLFILA